MGFATVILDAWAFPVMGGLIFLFTQNSINEKDPLKPLRGSLYSLPGQGFGCKILISSLNNNSTPFAAV